MSALHTPLAMIKHTHIWDILDHSFLEIKIIGIPHLRYNGTMWHYQRIWETLDHSFSEMEIIGIPHLKLNGTMWHYHYNSCQRSHIFHILVGTYDLLEKWIPLNLEMLSITRHAHATLGLC